MAYHYYIPFLEDYCKSFEHPRLLEVGVSTGTMLITMVQRLILSDCTFQYDAIDIKLNMDLVTVLGLIKRDYKKHTINYMEYNSLGLLPLMCEGINVSSAYKSVNEALKKAEGETQTPDIVIGKAYTVIMIDGDHNYFTVKRELDLALQMSTPYTLIVCDDYNTSYGEQDLFYSNLESHAGLNHATPTFEDEKTGVRPAVHEFLESHPEWKKLADIPQDLFTNPDEAFINDACILYHVDNPLWKDMEERVLRDNIDLNKQIMLNRWPGVMQSSLFSPSAQELEAAFPAAKKELEQIQAEIDCLKKSSGTRWNENQ